MTIRREAEVGPDHFEVVCEIEPPTRPDLMHVRHQIGVLSKVATAFLIPDNHIGRATVSSIAVAHEVERMGGRSIACLNARDRNLLGFRRDLLTAAAYGVDQFLFVYGDRPTSGARTGQLTVQSMIRELRTFPETHGVDGAAPFRAGCRAGRGSAAGVEARRRLPLRAGALLARRPARLARRRRVRRSGVRRRHGRAERRRWRARSPPTSRSSRCPTRGCARSSATRPPASSSRATWSTGIRESGAFDGVHLIPVEPLPRGRGGSRLGSSPAFAARRVTGGRRGVYRPRHESLLYGVKPDSVPVPETDNHLLRNLAHTPMKLVDMDEPGFFLPDWVVTKPRLTGICGSDSKQVFMDWGEVRSPDNPMKGFFSLPQVLGHEVVADVVALGPEAEGLEVGDRVVLNPWLSCGPRGVTPLCPACEVGDFSLCYSFDVGPIPPGIHIGTAHDVNGGYAQVMSAHDSQLFKVPDNVPDELAVFADPFAVSLHSITRHPPAPGGKVMVYGAGALGTCATAILRALYPDVEVLVVARFEAQAEMARKLGPR